MDLSQDPKKGIFPENGDIQWFIGGKLNVCYNCLDRHIENGYGDRIALIYERNEIGKDEYITYNDVMENVCRISNLLKKMGVRKGDRVCIYMSTNPYSIYAMLACARIGAVHVVVFAGFSSESLSERINDSQCKIIISNIKVLRGEKVIYLDKVVNESIKSCPSIKDVLFYDDGNDIDLSNYNYKGVNFYSLKDEIKNERPYSPCEWMDSEDPLFILYTSGSSGKPKGMIHTQSGYLLGTLLTTKYIFNTKKGDIHGCLADIGWITGHSYILYGPLSNGLTTVLFDSIPSYPDHGRYWYTVEKHKITQLYLSPTAIRSLMRYDDGIFNQYDLSSLKVLGSVGEPINPKAWEWYFNNIGKGKCPLVDTYWQTETGSIILSPVPGKNGGFKPGSCIRPFLGISCVLMDTENGKIYDNDDDIRDKKGILLLTRPWPSISRTILGCHPRYINAYFNTCKGYYSTSDGAYIDKDKYIWIFGRVDDVINVSGHRIGTSEIESSLTEHPNTYESAVIGIPHEIKGSSIVAFCVLKEGSYDKNDEDKIKSELVYQVRKSIGGLAVPEKIYIVKGLPKTRSGKIMRRLLRKIVLNTLDNNDDISTLSDPDIIEHIKKVVNGIE